MTRHTEHAVWAEGLTKSFKETKALTGVDLAVRTGTVHGVLGPNGAGKTTAVRILTTLLRADAGRALVGGFDVATESARIRAQIGLTGQYASVDEMLTGFENLLLIGRLLGFTRPQAKTRAGELLERFDLSHAADRAAKTFSGGMRRRLDLAASLVGGPRILFLDEPTTGLDPHARNELWAIVRELVAEGVTVLLTTQYLEEADQLADEIAVIDHGRVIATGAPEELKSKVGGQVLYVRAERGTDVGVVKGLLAEVAGREVTAEGEGLTVPVTDTKVMPAAALRLEQAGIEVAEFSLRRPSLDEVFLTLTGAPAQPVEVPA
ncbi:ATP-binding cassette domain-containing protein [Phytomonospora endophytica]|uniref:Oleandomycin transport system ATP-binding protein n=1 Tax=Phytomonospora endophytica TaxID=714109 RepID=A0A841FAZ5_9ACTN|nr:ATP-binding cassette domain-containing protein [Phytomonospora endophytica]MBB6033426.1 oleandomycin transport system ATP-binding protein [Phytomonospora endophytica]GIG70803.1 daunorubicin resistance protein DrrA family ABC transporter ATP-binding protein [Phytomonospora endophytica]